MTVFFFFFFFFFSSSFRVRHPETLDFVEVPSSLVEKHRCTDEREKRRLTYELSRLW